MKKLFTLILLVVISSVSNADFIDTDAKKLVITVFSSDTKKLSTLSERIDELNKKRLTDIVSAKTPSQSAAKKWSQQNDEINFFLEIFKDLTRASYLLADSVIFVNQSNFDQMRKALFFGSLCLSMPGRHGVFTNLRIRGNQSSQEYVQSLLVLTESLDSKDKLLIKEAALVADRVGVAYADICTRGVDPKNW